MMHPRRLAVGSKKHVQAAHHGVALVRQKVRRIVLMGGQYPSSGHKYEWNFGGGDPSHQESGREVSINVLLAEKVVAGSYFAVRPAK